ncbi:hypothetical protein Glove_292g3 [Diversispora epigaea]|uniref:Uncharacterized protein n=1 Tax=Diversispora epigaea TaxID=1348612 RepID=A0A397I088_9GLOM|nr:hypothetical protein Glove_292g3 [Diversispora epigaea]
MDDDSFYRMLDYHYLESEDEAEKFCEFVEEYGWRKEWESYHFTYWYWLHTFDMIKEHWKEKENPEALLQGFMNSNAFTLIEIISLIEGKELSNIVYGIWGKDECPPSYFESDSEESTSIT